MLDSGQSTHVASLIRHASEAPEIVAVNEMKCDTKSRQMLLRLVEYRSARRVCEIFGIDEDTLDEVLNGTAPWPPGMVNGVREAMARYDDHDSRAETDQAAGPCDPSGDDGSLTPETSDRKEKDALWTPMPAPTAEIRKSVPVVPDRQAQLQAIIGHIYAQCERANEILALNDSARDDDLRRLREELQELTRWTPNARTETEQETGAFVYARAIADRVVRKIDDELETRGRRSGVWWQRFMDWLRN